jgi:RNA polymerase sigma-70 factor (ECF subfamily)
LSEVSEDFHILQQAISGDAEAFACLFDLYVNRIYRYAYYLVGNHADAEDITQQAFINAWKAIGRFRPTDTPFVAWLITVTHNAAISFIRRRRPEVSLDFDLQANQNRAGVANAGSNTEISPDLREVVLGLKSDQQKVLLMRFVDELSYEEISAALGKSEGNIRVILHRALESLRGKLPTRRGQR